MVKSQIVGITPATHADAHRHGGTDPLTGDVRIDGLGWTPSGAEVVAAMASGAWTNLDLSAIVGANTAMVMLRVLSGVGASVVSVRALGDTDDYATDGAAANVAKLSGANKAGFVITPTDASGIIQYFKDAFASGTMDVVAYMKIA